MNKKRVILFEAVSTGKQAATDKQSLPEQDTQLHVIAEREDWEIVDIILVPGHSRVYFTYREFAESALEEGIPGPLRMFEHWRRQDFDVFACASGDRFGREQSIFAEVVGRTINASAVVFTLRDGIIDSSNRHMYVSMGGYQAAIEVHEIKRRRNFGMNKLAARGLPTSSKPLLSHVIIRDEFGNAIRLEVDETKRRLWDDVYRLIVEEHLSWGKLEPELNKLGHTTTGGKPLYPYLIHETIQSATFWGHSARFQVAHKHKRGWQWVYDPTRPVPKGVVIFRNTHPSVYTGDQLRNFIAEIERPQRQPGGRSRPYHSNRYAGLVLCRDCGRYMIYTGSQPFVYLQCRDNKIPSEARGCTNRGTMNPVIVDEYVRRTLQRIAEGEDLASVLEIEDNAIRADRLRKQLETELEGLDEESDDLIRLQRKAHRSQKGNYQKQIDELGEKKYVLEQQLEGLAFRASYDMVTQEQEAKSIIAMGEVFWQQSDTEINASLHRLFGKRRLVAYRKVVEGKGDAPKLGRPVSRKRKVTLT